LFSSLQNSEGGGGGDSGESYADPLQKISLLAVALFLFTFFNLILDAHRTPARMVQNFCR
jgi:hypothetical protein